MTAVRIGSRTVGDGHPVFFLAELSGNHNGSLLRALEIVDAAAEAGASAIKLQTFRPDTLTLNSRTDRFRLPDTGSPWAGRYLWDLYEEAHTPWEWHESLFARARANGLECISTAFDTESVDFLMSCGVDAIKISSFELIHLPLLRYATSTGIPIILSTGMASRSEVQDAVETVRGAGGSLIVLRSTSAYPASVSDANLRAIPAMREELRELVGLSDHTLSSAVVAAAVSLGACLIEKHLTLSRADGGPDALFSLEPEELAEVVRTASEIREALGEANLGPREAESASLWERPSVWVTSRVRSGEKFTDRNIRVLRPSGGLPPKHFPHLLDMVAARDLEPATPLTREHVTDRRGHPWSEDSR